MKRLQDILGGANQNLNILDRTVDVKTQMEYFEFSQSHSTSLEPAQILERESLLYDDEQNLEDKKVLLVNLASIDEPEAYRAIERYTQNAEPQLSDWSVLALQESRMLLESKYLDEDQIFISTGLGGKDDRLRYFVALMPIDSQGFTETQKNLIQSEFELSLSKHNAILEKLEFLDRYATMLALIPIEGNVRQPFQDALDECNSLGAFIQQGFMVTNIKELTAEEINQIILNNSSGKQD